MFEAISERGITMNCRATAIAVKTWKRMTVLRRERMSWLMSPLARSPIARPT